MAKKLTVALIYDFDGTLSPGNMQEYDFIPAIGKSNREFWEESNETGLKNGGRRTWVSVMKSRRRCRRKKTGSSSEAR